VEYQQGHLDLDAMMKRLKDLSAYSLTHADIQDRRQGVELLALGMFFGLSGDLCFHQNQGRLTLLSDETLTYEGQAEHIEQEVREQEAGRSLGHSHRDVQLRLL
jgi:hypothetical protein